MKKRLVGMESAGKRPVHAILSAITEDRFRTYEAQAHGSHEMAWRLYEWNIEVSAALSIPLSVLEVALRNGLHRAGAHRLGPDWLLRSHQLRFSEQRMIAGARRALDRRGKAHEDRNLIPELPFGFWVGLVSNHHDQTLWRTALFSAFPPGVNRRDLHHRLDHLRTLRNRIAHHEHLLHRDLVDDVNRIRATLRLLNPGVALWLDSISRAPSVIAQRPVPLGS